MVHELRSHTIGPGSATPGQPLQVSHVGPYGWQECVGTVVLRGNVVSARTIAREGLEGAQTTP